MRKTKIVCTIGPSVNSEEMIRKLCLAGMNVARLNFSHGTHEDHRKSIEYIKRVRDELELPIAILLDTKGPEFRIRTFEGGRVTLSEGARFVFTTEEVLGSSERVSVSYDGLPSELSVGDTILLNDGLMSFTVKEISGSEIITEVMTGGELTDRKSMSFPGKVMKRAYLSDEDRSDIAFGIEMGVDFIACSFVSTGEDLDEVHEYLDAIGAYPVELIAKIENQSGFDNIDEICERCDGIMVARGDMGVEVPFERLPYMQKALITKCRMLGKRVITATEMLESMIKNKRPTRAEISDVANAVYDGTSAIMLSGETAVGKNPILAVEAMAKIAETAEESIDYRKQFRDAEFKIKNTADAISHSTCVIANDIGAKAIVACTLSGMTARMVSRFRGPVPIIGLTTEKESWRRLALSWGVTPALSEKFTSTDVLFYSAKKIAKEIFSLKRTDKIIITGGNTSGKSGNTDIIKVEEI